MLIGIKDGGAVYLACSLEEYNFSVDCLEDREDSNCPLWKIKGNKGTIVGADSPATANPKMQFIKFEKDLFKGEITYLSILKNTIPELGNLCGQYEYLSNEKSVRCDLMIAQRDKLFVVDGTGYVGEVGEFAALGGSPVFATGVMEATRGMPVTERIREVFKARERMAGELSFPVAVMNTKNGKLEILYR